MRPTVNFNNIYFRFAGLIFMAFLGIVSIVASGGGGGGSSTADTSPPVTIATPPGGLYDSTQTVSLTANEPSTIYYSTDGNNPSVGGANTTSATSPVSGIIISDEGTTLLKFFAIDASGNQEVIKTESYTLSSSTSSWVGAYLSSLMPETALFLSLNQSGSTVEGTYTDKSGDFGIFSATVSGVEFDLTITSESDCAGTFTGNGIIINDTIFFTFSGSNCLGVHNDGEGIVTYQVGTVLDYGLSSPSNLNINNTHLIWTDLSEQPIKVMPASGGLTSSPTQYLGTPIGMTLYNNDIYWIDYRHEGSSYCIPGFSRVLNVTPLDGSVTQRLASGDSCLDERGTVVVDNNAAYFITNTPSPDTYTLQRVPLDGSMPTVIRTSAEPIETMTRDSSYLYWIEGKFPDPGVIQRIPLAGGSISTVATITNGIVGNLIAQGSNLFITELLYPYPYNYRILKIPVSGGSLTELATIGQKPYPLHLTSDATNVYWHDISGIYSVPITGGPFTPLANITGEVSAIAVDTSDVVWLEYDNFIGSIYSMPLSGGLRTTLASDLFTPYGGSLILASDTIYFTEGDALVTQYGRIAKIPRTGGDATPFVTGITAANNPMVTSGDTIFTVDGWRILTLPMIGGHADTIARSDFYIIDLATDNTYIYWLEGGPIQPIKRTPIGGGLTETLATSSNHAEIITTDGIYVYWVESLGTVKRVSIDGGAVSTLADAGIITDIISDGTYVYLADVSTDSILRVSINGGTVSHFSSLGPNSAWASLAQDSSSIYAMTDIDLRKAAKIDGSATILINDGFDVDIFNPSTIVVDSTNIYWTEFIGGTVKSYPK